MAEPTTYPIPTAKRLVLSLLSAPDLDQITVRQCTAWCELFAIEPAAMRVALGRLVKGGLLTTVRRGVYVIGPEGRALSETARSWVTAEERIGPWDGRWLLIHTAHLGRRDKTVLRNRERALNLEGFAALECGLWCRPANYLEPPDATRNRLVSLGLEPEAVLLRADHVSTSNPLDTELWPRDRLEARYASLTDAMNNSMQTLATRSDEEAARETFLIGESVIRQINSDPLLPDEMIDARARGLMHATMMTYDALGRGAWERFQRKSQAQA